VTSVIAAAAAGSNASAAARDEPQAPAAGEITGSEDEF
jgi:hypothetical protein